MTPSALAALATADTPTAARYIQEHGGPAAVEAALAALTQDGRPEERLLVQAGVKRIIEVYLATAVAGDGAALALNLKALCDFARETLARLAAHESVRARAELGLHRSITAPPALEGLRVALRAITTLVGPFVASVSQEQVTADAVRAILGTTSPQDT